jgi:hypothetical protein
MQEKTANKYTDILFITHLDIPQETGSSEIYSPLRLKLGKDIASFQALQVAAGSITRQEAMKMQGKWGGDVLTPFYLKDYMLRRNIVLKEIRYFSTGQEQIEAAIAEGVGLIAISTTWLPSSTKDATYVRDAAAKLKKIAPGIPVVVGGVGARKGFYSRQLLNEGKIVGGSIADFAKYYLLMNPVLDKNLDVIITSEGGEATLAAIAMRIRNGMNFYDLSNLAFPNNGSYSFTKIVPEPIELDNEIVNWQEHIASLSGRVVPIRTAVGCPFHCGFCDFTSLYKPKLRSIDSLMTEIKTLPKADHEPYNIFLQTTILQ